MTLSYTQIVETFEDGTGNPIPNGTAAFAVNTTIYASGVPILQPDVPVKGQIINGQLRSPSGGTLQLLDLASTNLSMVGQTGFWFWTVSITAGGQVLEPWSFFLEHSSSPVDLYSLANTQQSTFANPMTQLGDLIVGAAGGSPSRLPGNTSATREFLVSQGTGSAAQAQAYSALQAGDIPPLPDYAPSGLTGATAASRYVGATNSGAPVSGTFAVGDFIVDRSGAVWVCTTAGSPGTWTQAGGGGGGGGSVTSVSVTAANGFAGTVANPTSTPAITVSTTVTGLLKGNGTAVSAATAGTDYLAPAGNGSQLTGITVSQVTGAAPLASPALSGTPTAPTATASTSTTQVATTAFVQAAIPASLDGTASDIQPSPGTRAAGSAGKPADAAHVHGQPPVIAPTGLTGATAASRYAGATVSGPPVTGTFSAGDWVQAQDGPVWLCATGGTPGSWKQAGDQPWQFRPETYGAKRDGKIVTDGAMTASSGVLTCATSHPFTAGANKYALVWAAATSSTYLFAAATFTDSSHVTLGTAAGNTVSATGVLYGTNDDPAIQSAINAAAAYSAAGNGTLGQVLLSEGIYCSATAAVPGIGTTFGNGVITLPVIDPTSGVKVQIEIIGAGSSQLPHWTQPQPPQAGSIIAAMRTDGSLDNSYGPTTLLGGPVNGYGGGGGTFSNMHLRLQGFTILAPVSSGAYCGADLYGIGQASVDDFSYLPLAVVPASTTWPSLATYGSSTYYPAYSFGLRMPADGNNAVADIGTYTCYFAQIGLIGSEHCTFRSIKTIYTLYGLLPMTNTGGTVSHGISGVNWCCENVGYPIGSVASGFFALDSPIGINVTRLDLENYISVVNDGSGLLYGTAGFNIPSSATSLLSTLYAAGSGTGLKLVRLEAAQGPLASQPSVPSSTTAFLNGYYRDALVTVTGGVVSQIAVDSTNLNITAGTFLVPAGHTITLTYTSAPNWEWTIL